jgi:predicted RNA-binding Zn ribbon-like protein
MPEPAPVKMFQFIAGELCLDFCNTMGGKRSGIAREKLESYGDLLAWCEQAGLVNPSLKKILARRAAKDPQAAATVLNRSIRLRESIFEIFAALARQRETSLADRKVLNSELAANLGRLRVKAEPAVKGFSWTWENGNGALDQVLGPIARSAADLLTSGDWEDHVRECGGENCGWLFLDSSKNHSRRWCDMRDCGNRAKVRRHRRKQSHKG